MVAYGLRLAATVHLMHVIMIGMGLCIVEPGIVDSLKSGHLAILDTFCRNGMVLN